jgi:hypothetical protein
MANPKPRRTVLAVAAAVSLSVLPPAAPAQPAAGPLRVLDANPRYFTDGSGKAVHLVGSHNWSNFQDTAHRQADLRDPPPAFDYDAYLAFLEKHHHKFFRLWRWEAPRWTDEKPPGVKYARPHPWAQPGPGAAADGKPKFDLTRFDGEYFARLRDRVARAGWRGMNVSVMLFEAWEMQFTDAWQCHPLRGPNNANGIDADAGGRGLLYNQLRDDPMGRRVLALREAYVRRVVDTVNDLDNVLSEVANEAGD